MRIITLAMIENGCEGGKAKFKELFGDQVECTADLCRIHAMTFRPWGAIAWILLSKEGYAEWSPHNKHRFNSINHPKQFKAETELAAIEFARIFNKES
jgi:hypothetical protein